MDKNEYDSSTETSFFQRVYEVVKKIPYGKVMSYGQIAWAIGAPHSARQVGWAMKYCPDNLPFHRVVKADGTITGGMYSDFRRDALLREGILFLPDGRVDMKASVWRGYE